MNINNLKELKDIVKKIISNKEWLKLRDYCENLLLSEDLEIRSNAFFYKGISLDHIEEYENAIQEYTKCIDLDHSFINAYIHRGFSYFTIREYEKANIDFNKAIELDPKLEFVAN